MAAQSRRFLSASFLLFSHLSASLGHKQAVIITTQTIVYNILCSWYRAS